MRYLGRKGLRAFGIGLALVVAACGGDTTSPGDAPDDAVFENPQQVVQATEALSRVMDTDQFRSLATLDGAPGLEGAGAQMGAAMSSLVRAASGSDVDAGALKNNLDRMAMGPSFDIIPADALGKTFEWDTSTGSYADLGTPGAPANGMRVVLYVTDEDGVPVEPLIEVGYLELIETRNTISATVWGPGGAQYVYFRIIANGDNTLRIEAFVQDGSNRIDLLANYTEVVYDPMPAFETCIAMADVPLCPDAEFEIRFEIDVANPSMRLIAVYSFDFTEDGWEIERITSFREAGHVFMVVSALYFEALGDQHYEATFQVAFIVDDHILAILDATGHGNELRWVAEDGTPLSDEDVAAITSLYGAPLPIIMAFREMMAPVTLITGLDMLLPPVANGMPAGGVCDSGNCTQ